MPSPLRELIANAEASGNWDAVADWCETFDWTEGEEVPVAEFYLGCAVAARPRNESQIVEAVSAARASGTSWDRVGEILSLSAQSTKERYEPLLDSLNVLTDADTKSAFTEAETELKQS